MSFLQIWGNKYPEKDICYLKIQGAAHVLQDDILLFGVNVMSQPRSVEPLKGHVLFKECFLRQLQQQSL